MNRAVRQVATDPVDLALRDLLADRRDLRVIDVGGGSGSRAVPLARLGCRVTVLDASIDALAILQRRAAEAGVADLVRGVQADAERIADVAGAASADLVLCHQVLEEVDDPDQVLSGCADVLAPGGHLSVLTAARYAAVLAQVRTGRIAEAVAMVSGSGGRSGPGDALRRRFDVATLRAALARAGLEVRSVIGVGVVAGLQDHAGAAGAPASTAGGGAAGDPGGRIAADQLFGDDPVLRELARDLHAVASKSPNRS
jgi:S-adenosylmethionine-dependent methyltransferase